VVDWIAIDQWERCVEMARPGIIFELRNVEDLRMFTPCVTPLPAPPWDWKSPAIEFRPVPAPEPRHSGPLPPPEKG
jgi:hypothetical protein